MALKLTDATTFVRDGLSWWRLFVQTDRGLISYELPVFTFEARQAEFGITDPDELLELVLLELEDTGEDHVDPYSVDEDEARTRRRAARDKVKGRHPVSYDVHPAKGNMRQHMRQRMRLKASNIDALKHVAVEGRKAAKRRQAAADKAASKQPAARTFAAADADVEDTAGPVFAAKRAMEVQQLAEEQSAVRAAALEEAGLAPPADPAT